MTSLNKPMMPFDENRHGFVLGEGAGVLILEELEHAKSRDAHIYAEVLGYGHANDTSAHFAAGTVQGYEDSMAEALRTTGLSPSILAERIVHVNAHGTGTKLNDLVEMQALRNVFGEYISNIYINSLKGTIGHPQAAASSLELIADALSLKEGIIPPSTNIERIDKEFTGLKIVTQAVQIPPHIILKNASGFCGVYSTIVLAKYDKEEK